MSPHRCQICGRRKGLRKAGGIAHHHVQGRPCAGIGHPPIEEAHACLESEIARLRGIARVKRAFVRDLLARRVNYIDPAHEKAADAAERAADKLARRLKRHLDWPARYERQMARDGMAMPPPTYLLSR